MNVEHRFKKNNNGIARVGFLNGFVRYEKSQFAPLKRHCC